MTLELLRNEIWQQIGEPSDLDPSSDTSYNGGPFLTWVVNEGQRHVASWKDVQAGGRVMRLPQLIGEMFHKTTVWTGTLTDNGTLTQVTLPGSIGGGEADRYNGWILEVNGEYKLVVDYLNYQATVHEEFSSAPATGDSFALYKRFDIMLVDSDPWASEHLILPEQTTRFRTEGHLIQVLKVEDVQEQRELKVAAKPEAYTANLVSVGTPGRWWVDGNRLFYNEAWDEPKWLRITYYRLPTDMVVAVDEPEVPEQYHYGIVLWGCWWGFRRQQENAAAYSLKRDFEDFMRSTVSVADISSEKRSDAGYLRRK